MFKLKSLPAALAAIAVAGASSLAFTATAIAADMGVVSSIILGVSQDGTAPFNAMDGGALNGIVRTQDQIVYTAKVSYSTTGLVTFTATTPPGMEWDQSAAAADVCNADGPSGGTITTTDTGSTLVCQRNVVDLSETFTLPAWVYSVGNGAEVKTQIASGAQSATSPGVTVAAEVKTELSLYAGVIAPNAATQKYMWDGHSLIGATAPSKSFNGYEALADPFIFKMKLPPNSVVTASVSIWGHGQRHAGLPLR